MSQIILSRMLHQFFASTAINQQVGEEHVLLLGEFGGGGQSRTSTGLLHNSDKPDANICISIKNRRPNLSLPSFQGSSLEEKLWELLKKQMAPTQTHVLGPVMKKELYEPPEGLTVREASNNFFRWVTYCVTFCLLNSSLVHCARCALDSLYLKLNNQENSSHSITGRNNPY